MNQRDEGNQGKEHVQYPLIWLEYAISKVNICYVKNKIINLVDLLRNMLILVKDFFFSSQTSFFNEAFMISFEWKFSTARCDRMVTFCFARPEYQEVFRLLPNLTYETFKYCFEHYRCPLEYFKDLYIIWEL